jgi:hypothetical protein
MMMRTTRVLLLAAMSWSTIGPLRGIVQAAQTVSSDQRTVVIRIEKKQGQIRYIVDSQRVADPLPALTDLLKSQGADSPVIALFNWDATLQQVYDVEILASKAGFKTVRPFVVKNGFMVEIKFGPSVPLSSNPPL